MPAKKPAKKSASTGCYEVQTDFLSGEWENVWTANGQPETFPTKAAAQKALKAHLEESELAYEDGEIDEPDYPENFRVVPCGTLSGVRRRRR